MSKTFAFRFSGDVVGARLKKVFSQQFVAEAAGISVREYQRIEKGIRQPRAETFLRLIFILELDIEHYREVVFPYMPPLPR